MKIRRGFVTNSSSSSFICEVCGHDVSGYDMCISDTEMAICQNGHTFCIDHSSLNISEEDSAFVIAALQENIKQADRYKIDSYWTVDRIAAQKKAAEKNLEDYLNNKISEYTLRDIISDALYNVPTQYCPICSFESFRDEDLLLYILKDNKINLEDVKKDIKQKFESYDDFIKYKRGK